MLLSVDAVGLSGVTADRKQFSRQCDPHQITAWLKGLVSTESVVSGALYIGSDIDMATRLASKQCCEPHFEWTQRVTAETPATNRQSGWPHWPCRP